MLKLIMSLFVSFFLVTSAHAAILSGRVVGIADGDTITILDSSKSQHKIRLAGIDTPEKGQPFGNRAKENLSSIVFGKSVSIEYDKRDRYGRIVGKVMVGIWTPAWLKLRQAWRGISRYTRASNHWPIARIMQQQKSRLKRIV